MSPVGPLDKDNKPHQGLIFAVPEFRSNSTLRGGFDPETKCPGQPGEGRTARRLLRFVPCARSKTKVSS